MTRDRLKASAADAGETSRVHPQVPMKLAVFDSSVALLPLAMDQLVDSALVVHQCALLDALTEMFDLLWEQAVPVVPPAGETGLDGWVASTTPGEFAATTPTSPIPTRLTNPAAAIPIASPRRGGRPHLTR
ncbi:hypothetical protein [Micromonospora sp. IBHARD004]|uniref:hypothetical protein n=1 Tax=Micromonospora sp. IBHARD004 TaxID=3457764 RepID=UPI0040595160